MRAFIGVLFSLVLIQTGLAQNNLVVNPSFEGMILCPPSLSYFDGYVSNWSNPSNGSPDYFCNCSNPSLIPFNFIGYQLTHSGNCYVGIGNSITNPSIEQREFIQGQLSEPLIADTNYCIQYYASLADNWSTIGIERLGIYFSTGSSFFNTISVLPVTPSAYATGIFFTDTSNWQKVQMEYIASGGETHFIIGNLLDSNNSPYQPIVDDYIDTLPMSPGWYYRAQCYYYIDDVSITQGQCPVEEVEPVVFVPDAFSPNGDGNNDVLYVRGANIATISFAVYDRWGQQVFYSEQMDKGWDGTYKGSFLNNAVFAYTLHVTFRNGKEKDYSGNVSLIR